MTTTFWTPKTPYRAMVALTLSRCALEKFGGDSMLETLRNFEGYRQQLKNY